MIRSSSKLFPRSKREWAEAAIAESELMDHGAPRLGRLLVYAWYLALKGAAMTTVLATLSTMCVLAGLALGTWGLIELQARVIPLFGVGLIVQGGFTLWILMVDPEAARWRRLLVAGQTVALVVGIAGLIANTVGSLVSGDPEYGPMLITVLIFAQAGVTLYVYALRGDPVVE